MDRRDFLRMVGSLGLGAAALPAAIKAFFEYERTAEAADPSFKSKFSIEAQFYSKLPNKKIKCHICPLNCELVVGET